jgi:hypothetical protein
MFFQRRNIHRYSPILTGTMFVEKNGEEDYERIGGGTRVLELAADNWEVALGHGAR